MKTLTVPTRYGNPHCQRSTIADIGSQSSLQNLHTLQVMSRSRLSPLCGKHTTFLKNATPRNPAFSKKQTFPFLASSAKSAVSNQANLKRKRWQRACRQQVTTFLRKKQSSAKFTYADGRIEKGQMENGERHGTWEIKKTK